MDQFIFVYKMNFQHLSISIYIHILKIFKIINQLKKKKKHCFQNMQLVIKDIFLYVVLRFAEC